MQVQGRERVVRIGREEARMNLRLKSVVHVLSTNPAEKIELDMDLTKMGCIDFWKVPWDLANREIFRELKDKAGN